ncbi:uncharacterized protein HMPREF1541_04919 [Cyphellophora europaea CBS 101466]|uniref:SAF domain-containing protein n=1 Tax=Cyphellophora europaea (strain CBS 101466) TaxID=1220924 RepID=W2RWE5_CYPE1|nr:uncharacterized protein HMPREF1541_04919 [Cyphellophora europaea CBS 101466]ETN40640.1 hypothetical protein HMPREF1541_04919 [Cyphellophora europaea CBS 101466]
MSCLSEKLAEREVAGRVIQVGVIGAGKFGSMFIAQAHTTPGIHLAAVCDLDLSIAREALRRTNYPAHLTDTTGTLSLSDGIASRKTILTTSAADMIAHPSLDVVLECTGIPSAGVAHTLLCCEHKKHIVMINVEADVLAGPLLARRAREAGIVYSMAYGDQPALISELVDWARTSGFRVVCAGKGNKYLPEYNYSTPETVWDHWGFSAEQLAKDKLNSQIYNSFLDGTKSALEMAAVANGCGLAVAREGLTFRPCGYQDLAACLKPRSRGGGGEEMAYVEVVSSLERDGRDVWNHARHGVFVVIEATSEYQKEAFAQYGMETDKTGWFAAQYKPWHLIGLEVGVSIANIMCRGEPTGSTKTFAGDVVATAKKNLVAGEMLDGEGGHTVVGKLMPAEVSLEIEGLPIGLAHGLKLKRDVKKDQGLSWADVEFSEDSQVVKVRREMEAIFREEFAKKAKGIKPPNGVLVARADGNVTNGVNGHH